MPKTYSAFGRYKRRSRPAKMGKRNLNKFVRRVVTNIAETKTTNSPSATPYDQAPTATGWDVRPIFADPAVSNGALLIPTGSSSYHRIGNRILLKKLTVNVFIRPKVNATASAMAGGSVVRVMIVRDRQCNGAVPADTTILNYGASKAAYTATMNQDTKRRFTVVKELVHTMVVTATDSAGTVATACGPPLIGKLTMYPKLEIIYNGTDGDIAEVVGNQYYILVAASMSSCCDVLGSFHAEFVDV